MGQFLPESHRRAAHALARGRSVLCAAQACGSEHAAPSTFSSRLTAADHAKHRCHTVTHSCAWCLFFCLSCHGILLLLEPDATDAASLARHSTRAALGCFLSLDRVLHIWHVSRRTATASAAWSHGSDTADRQRYRDGPHRRLLARHPCRQVDVDWPAGSRSGLERLWNDERPRLCACAPFRPSRSRPAL